MASFHVDKVYYLAREDLLVISGEPDDAALDATWWIDLPERLKGPGYVPVSGVQMVPFANGVQKLCVLLDYALIDSHPLLEFSDLEGEVLGLRPGEH